MIEYTRVIDGVRQTAVATAQDEVDDVSIAGGNHANAKTTVTRITGVCLRGTWYATQADLAAAGWVPTQPGKPA